MSLSPAELSQIPPQELQQIPALAPPAGVIPNFVNPPSREHVLIIWASVLFCLMLVFYLNRIYTKLSIIGKLTVDDLTCTIGLAGANIYYVFAIIATTEGQVGRHQWDVPVSTILNKEHFIVPLWFGVVLVPPSSLFIKATFFIMYLQIFQPIRWLRISVYIGLVLLCCFYGATTIVQFYFASPKPGETWVENELSGRTENANTLSVPLASVGFAFDLYLFVLPLAAIQQVQLPTRRKVGVTMVFLTGVLACVGSVLSIYFRKKQTADVTWTIVNVELMVVVEMYIGVICACMPAFSKMINHHLPIMETVWSRLYGRLSGLGSKVYSSRGSSFKQWDNRDEFHSNSKTDSGRTPDRQRRRSASRGADDYTQTPYELGQMKTVHSYVGRGERLRPEPSDDRIYLTREVRWKP